MDIPNFISKARTTYEWEGSSLVQVFTSSLTICDYKGLIEEMGYSVDRYGDDQVSLNYILKDGRNRKRFQFMIGVINEDFGAEDVMSYVGEDQFDGLDFSGATLAGVFFVFTDHHKVCKNAE